MSFIVDATTGYNGSSYQPIQLTTNNNTKISNVIKEIDYIIPIMSAGNYNVGFTNNTNINGAIEVLSSSVSDTAKLTLIYIEQTTNAMKYETITMNGTNVVTTVASNINTLRGAFIGTIAGKESVNAVGTITIRTATGDQTICTIATTKKSVGVVMFLLPGKQISIDPLNGTVFTKTVSSASPTSTADALLPTLFTTYVDNGLTLTAGKVTDTYLTNYVTIAGDTTTSPTFQVIVWKEV